MIEHGLERNVEIGHHRFVGPLAIGYCVELAFHLRGEVDIEDFGEALHENPIHIAAERRRVQTALLLLDVCALFDGPDSRRVRRWSSDTQRFQFFHERALGNRGGGSVALSVRSICSMFADCPSRMPFGSRFAVVVIIGSPLFTGVSSTSSITCM